jgi:phage baseplate assembly protein W
MARHLSSITILAQGQQWVSDGNFQFLWSVNANSVGEVLQNVLHTLSTPLGSQVLLRAFGMSQRWIDQPGSIGQYQARTAALLSIGLWEPRAKVTACDFNLDTEDVLGGSYGLYLELEVDLTQVTIASILAAPPPAPLYVLDAPFSTDGSTVPAVVYQPFNIFTG